MNGAEAAAPRASPPPGPRTRSSRRPHACGAIRPWRIERLGSALGLSERQLRGRFAVAVGYGPKTLQRVLRFRHFLAAAEAGPQRAELAPVAFASGYADQAHLTRDCTRLAGLAPAALLRSRGARSPERLL